MCVCVCVGGGCGCVCVCFVFVLFCFVLFVCLFFFPESIIDIFCECDFVRRIWEELFKIIKDKHDVHFTASNCDEIFEGFLMINCDFQ